MDSAIKEAFQDAMAAGETAFGSGDYEGALEWFQKAKDIAPADVYALSRTGAAAVALNRFDTAMECFKKAVDVQPENGDNVFNLGNAYFFNGDFNHAIEQYARAEILGCSKNAQARLCYQLSLMSMMQGKLDAALLNFQKFEDMDESKRAASDPKIILEKLRLYMLAKDYAHSAECAVQLIQTAPQAVRGYLVYFNLLVGAKKYDEAEKTLDDAERYAKLNEEETLSVKAERIALLLVRSGAEPEKAEAYREQALEMIGTYLKEAKEGSRTYNQMMLSLAEVQLMREQYREAAAAATVLLPETDAEKASQIAGQIKVHKNLEPAVESAEMDDAAFDELVRDALADMQEKINVGLIDRYLIEQATQEYDSDGSVTRIYPDGAFDAMEAEKPAVKAASADAPARAGSAKMRPDFYERARFLLVTALVSLEEFEPVKKQAAMLRGSKNTMYAFFGMYAEALAQRKTGNDPDDEIYNALLAFFRSRMLKKNFAPYAAMYRARMYAEMGKFAKAGEMAKLVPEGEKQSLAAYIESCKQEGAAS